jgi:hypothetical protein
MTLTGLLAIGDASMIGFASAAKVMTAAQRTHFAPGRVHRAYRAGYGPVHRGVDRGWTYYYGRPYFYAPAPIPLGFDFGFGW